MLTLRIKDNTVLQVKWALSGKNISVITVASGAAIPVAVSASLATYGFVSITFMAGFMVSIVGTRVTLQRAFAAGKSIVLPRDMPAGVREIRKLET